MVITSAITNCKQSVRLSRLWPYLALGIEMSLLSPGIAILFEHSDWFQPLFGGLDRRGIPYDRLLAAELSYDPRAHTFSICTHSLTTSVPQPIVLGQTWPTLAVA